MDNPMTIDEAIKELEKLKNCASQLKWMAVVYALDLAIKALKNMKIMCSFDRDSEEYDCD